MPFGVDRQLELQSKDPRRTSSLDGLPSRPALEDEFYDYDYSDEFDDEDDGGLESFEEEPPPEPPKKAVSFSDVLPKSALNMESVY